MARHLARHRSIPVLLVVGVLLAVSGVAAAIWTGSAAGAGTVGTGTSVALTLGPGNPGSGLYPGGSADVVLTISNANRAAATVDSLALDPGRGTGGFAIDVGHLGCALSTLTFTTASTGWVVPARVGTVDGSLPVTLSGALSMGIDAADACQGATVTVYLMAGG